MLRAHEQSNAPLGKFCDDSLNQWYRGVRVVIGGKQNLVLRVFLPAKTCKIFVSVEVRASDRLEHADGWGVIRDVSCSLALEEAESRQSCERVVNQRSSSQQQHRISPHLRMRRHADLPITGRDFPFILALLATLTGCHIAGKFIWHVFFWRKRESNYRRKNGTSRKEKPWAVGISAKPQPLPQEMLFEFAILALEPPAAPSIVRFALGKGKSFPFFTR